MPVEHVILHIGRHKSGTSALQRYLSCHCGELAKAGVLYPNTGRQGIAHHALAYSCGGHPSATADPIALRDQLEMESVGLPTILISSEWFQNLKDLDGLRTVIEPYKSAQITVICYVREHVDYMISAFRQMVQNQPRFLPFGRFLSRVPDLAAFVEKWAGIGDLRLNLYDRSLLRNGSMIDDFWEVAELPDIRCGLRSPYGVSGANPSLGGNLLFLKLAANFLERDFLNYRQLEDLIARHAAFQTAFYLPAAQVDRFQRSSKYNNVLIDTFGTVPMKSWKDCPVLPADDHLTDDLGFLLSQHPEIELADLVKLSATAREWFSFETRD